MMLIAVQCALSCSPCCIPYSSMQQRRMSEGRGGGREGVKRVRPTGLFTHDVRWHTGALYKPSVSTSWFEFGKTSPGTALCPGTNSNRPRSQKEAQVEKKQWHTAGKTVIIKYALYNFFWMRKRIERTYADISPEVAETKRGPPQPLHLQATCLRICFCLCLVQKTREGKGPRRMPDRKYQETRQSTLSCPDGSLDRPANL